MKGFEPIKGKSTLIKSALTNCLKPKILTSISNFDFRDKIAVHIRLGDFGSDSLPIKYYKSLIEQVHYAKPHYKFLIFSDGTDEELKDIISLPYTQRVFFGSSMSDILAIASCKALIGSHSTFSDWGGYLGQIPSLLPKKPHYGSFLDDLNKEFIVNADTMEVDKLFFNWL